MPVATKAPAIMPNETTEIFRARGQHTLILGLLLVVATLALYNPVSQNGFVNFDDDRYVTANSEIRAGVHLSTISWAFTSLDQANWHPLTWLSHALDYQLFHLNAAGHHYTNVVLHAANVLLLFLILRWFTGCAARSLVVAALFAIHPLNVESVAWVAERKNVLCMFFFLLTLVAYGWYVSKPGIMRYLSVVLLFACALMSKPMAITLPFALLLLDYWPLRRMRIRMMERRSSSATSIARGHSDEGPSIVVVDQSVVRLGLEKIPLLALSAGSAIITMIAQRAGGAITTSAAHAPLLRIENVIVSYALYIKKVVWPSHLAVLYPYPHNLPGWEVAISAMFLLAVTVVVWKHRDLRYLPVGWFWYLGTMVPMIGLVQVGNQSMADRYAYLPAIGLFVMIVWTVSDWFGASHLSPKLLAASTVVILLSLSAVTRIQLQYWHDDFTLWARALAVTQNNFVAENNFANALMRQGHPEEAIIHFSKASALEPGDPASHLNLGIYAQEHGNAQLAVAHYNEALRLATDAQIRAAAFSNLGTVYFAQRDYTQAQRNFDEALKLKPIFPRTLLDLGLIAQKTATTNADWNRVANYLERFVAAEPSDVGYFLLAHALHQAGRNPEADLAYQHSVQLSTDVVQTQQRAAQLATQ
jgi:protein O-mannosyl-transferase